MTNVDKVNAELKKVNQEVAGDQVRDVARTTITAAPATQNTEVPLQSSSISSNYAAKFLNFDNIPSDTIIISMMEIKVQHEDPSIQTSPLLTVPISVILKSSTAPVTTIPPPIPPFILLPQQSTPIPTPTTTEATISTTILPDSTTLTTIHQRVSDLEKEVKILKDINHDLSIIAVIKFEVLSAVKECLGTNLDDTLEKVIKKQLAKFIQEHSVPAAAIADAINKQLDSHKSVVDIRKIKMEKAGKQPETKYTIISSDTTELQEFDQKITLFETMTKTKSFNKNTKHRALYHYLMQSIVEDEDAMDKGVADRLKKRKPDDTNKDEGPPAVPDQGLKRKKTIKETKPSKKAKSTGTSKGITKSQPKSTSKSAQAEETVFEAADTQVPQNPGEDMGNTSEPSIVKANPKGWFKKLERPPTLDPEWNKCKIVDNKPTQKWLSDLAKAEKPSKMFNELMRTPIDFTAFAMNRLYVELEYNMEECYKALNDQLDWNNPEGDRYPFDLSKPPPLVKSRNRQIVPADYFFNDDLAYLQEESTDRTYTTSLTKMNC
ncbi:hypothetical protein Tco_1159930 [Tanacetum coccineum]